MTPSCILGSRAAEGRQLPRAPGDATGQVVIDEIVQFLQLSLTPVALISGVGLLLLTVTNRFGRVVDRTRFILEDADQLGVAARRRKEEEFDILYRRSRMLRRSIMFITASIISSTLLIPLLMFMFLLQYDLRFAGYALFAISTLSILASAVYFFMDVTLALKALDIEARGLRKSDQPR